MKIATNIAKLAFSVLVVLLTLRPACAQQMMLSGSKLDELDRSPKIAENTGSDRLSKSILGLPGQESADFSLGTLIGGLSELAESPETPTIICNDLRMGDDQLSRALQNALVALNVPSGTAQAMVEKWAMYGPDEALQSLMSNVSSVPDVASPLIVYFMESDPDWVKLVRGSSALISGDQEGARMAFATAVANATGQTSKAIMSSIDKSRSGDFVQLWNLMANAKKILASRGALSREMIAQQNTEGSIYDKGWAAVMDNVAQKDLETRSYIKGTLRLMPLYSAYSECLRTAMKEGGKEAILLGIIKGSSIPESRFRWMVEELSGQTYETFTTDMAVERTAKKIKGTMSDNLSEAVTQDPIWAGVLLWHLTRPAEATALAVRLSLPDTLASDTEFARDYIKGGTPLGALVDQYVLASGGYSHYPGGKPETVEKFDSDEITKEALLKLSQTIAEVLMLNDQAWDAVINPGPGGANQDWMKRIVLLTLSRSPGVAPVWAQTMVKNDLALGRGFAKWLTDTNSQLSDQNNAPAWIASVAQAATASQSFGNSDMARFKKLFSEFMVTPQGWEVVRTRLGVEGLLFPSVIRNMLVAGAVDRPQSFWRLFKILTAADGDSVARLRPQLEEFIRTSVLPQMILDETSAENAFAADASAVIWKSILQPRSPAIRALVKEMTDLKTKTEPHALGNLCFVEEISSPKGWAMIRDAAPAMLEKIKMGGVTVKGATDKEQVIYALTNHSDACGDIYEQLLGNNDFQDAWASRVLTKVLFMGKTTAAAWLVKQNTELMDVWREEMARQISTDPFLLKAFVDSLATRRIGDRNWVDQVNAIRRQIAALVFFDRILVEQMLGYPEQEYRRTLSSEITRVFGEYVTDQWKEVSSQ